MRHRLPGLYNVAADGVLALSEVAGLLGKRYAPVLPPWGTGISAAALRRVGVRIPPEAMNQLRYGRGVDNRRFKAAGFGYQHTSRETVLKLGEHLRLHPVVRGLQEPYRYEREVEDFLRWSPHVKNARAKRSAALSRDQIARARAAPGGASPRRPATTASPRRRRAATSDWPPPRRGHGRPTGPPSARWSGPRRPSGGPPSRPSRRPSGRRRQSGARAGRQRTRSSGPPSSHSRAPRRRPAAAEPAPLPGRLSTTTTSPPRR